MITIKIRKSKFMPDDFSAFVSFPFNQNIIDCIKSFKYRSWIKGTKEWEIRIDDIELLMDEFPQMDFDISGRYVDLTPKKAMDAKAFKFKTECYKHQVEGFNYGMSHERWLLGDEQGLGKTKQAIDIAVARKQSENFTHCLIICGKNNLKWNWQKEIQIHSNEEGYILGQKVRKRTGELYIGSNKDKLHDIERLDELGAYFIITNVETLRDSAVASEIVNWLHREDGIQMIVADEVHAMKNPASQQGKAFIKLDSKVRVAMTGTPMMNSPLDLYIILRWLGYEKHAFGAFKRHYAVFGGYGGYEIVGYRYLDELEEQLQSIMLRRLKDEVLDLPEKTYIEDYVDMLPKQTILYKEIKNEINAHVDQLELSPNPLAMMIRLRQVTGCPEILSSSVTQSAKLDRMMEIVNDTIANGRKLIIFSNWTALTDSVEKILSAQQVKFVTITGQTSDSERPKNVEIFQNDPECKVILGTTGACGVGITLSEASVIIFLDHPWNRAIYDQAVDRAHRIGQTKNVTIYNIMCKNTIDERIWQIVQTKGALSDSLVDGKIVANKKEIIDFLLS